MQMLGQTSNTGEFLREFNSQCWVDAQTASTLQFQLSTTSITIHLNHLEFSWKKTSHDTSEPFGAQLEEDVTRYI